ncbi:MAG TPA: glycosyl hydrolase family 39 [Candidatus Xenobia bacterium]|jgi:xylan 1,4-beta-xylosidase
MKRLLLIFLLLLQAAFAQDVEFDLTQAGRPFPHVWEQTFGSGRAILTLRDSWRQDARAVHAITGFKYVRFHAIFHDEVGLCRPDGYNFTYIDQIYDGLLQNGLKPYVELGFMPKALASQPPVYHAFWYQQITSPPADYGKWDAMIGAFARHLVDRYGIDEVARWPFEVWNEPNIDFWAGDPKEATYYELYDHTARALKRVSPRLQVGGPATAQAAWVDRFIAHCVSQDVPVDFISTHVYANDTAHDVFGTDEHIDREHMVARAVAKVHDQIAASARPHLPLVFSEFNASYANEVDVTDSPYMGPWLASTIAQVDGLVNVMAYWCVSDVFEEQGIARRPFYGGFGLLAPGGIPKSSFNAFALLHKLGDRRLPCRAGLLTRTRTGYAAALWNYTAPDEGGADKIFHVHVKGAALHHARLWRVDETHGNALAAWVAMGRPDFPTRPQQAALRSAGALSPPQNLELPLEVRVPAHGLVLIELY